jgi:hypothetical protein
VRAESLIPAPIMTELRSEQEESAGEQVKKDQENNGQEEEG